MTKSVFVGDRRRTWQTMADHVRILLGAEYASIMVVPEENPRELVLAGDSPASRDLGRRFLIQSVPGGGLTGHIAAKGVVARLDHPQLQANEYVRGLPPTHLPSGHCYSLLAIPLRDRKRRVCGLLKADNKLGLDGKPGAVVSFDKADKGLVRILAASVELVLESVRVMDAITDITQAIQRAGDVDCVSSRILRRGAHLVGATHGAILSPGETALASTIRASFGETTPAGAALVREGALYAWQHDVFTPARRRGIHAMLIPLKAGADRVGILSMQGRKPFDNVDADLMQLLAQFVVVAVHVVGKQTLVGGVMQHLAEPPVSETEVERKILESVRDSYAVDAGIVYVADYKTRTLRCVCHIGCEHLPVRNEEFTQPFDGISLAAKVRSSGKAYFSPDPHNDPSVDKRGLQAFDIRSALVGIPLIFRDRVVGVLVNWRRVGDPLTQSALVDLEPFARLAATTIAVAAVERERERFFRAVRNILDPARHPSFLDETIRLILEATRDAGFDRVRLMEYRHEGGVTVAVGRACVPSGDPKDFVGMRIPEDENANVKANLESWLRKPEPRIQSEEENLKDPDSGRLGIDPALPKAVAPLMAPNGIYGFLAADNNSSCREITTEMLAYEGVFASLAAQAIANVTLLERIQMADGMAQESLLRVCHGLKAPLNQAAAYAELLRRGLRGGSKSQSSRLQDVEEHLSQIRNMISTVEDGLSGQTLAPPREPMSLRKACEDSLLAKRSFAVRQGVYLHHSLEDDPCSITANPREINQCLDVLLDNAIKVTPRRKAVKLDLAARVKTFLVRITDEGPGVAEDDRGRIYEKGVTIGIPSVPAGHGLGLYIARGIARSYGGEISRSDRKRGGAQFVLTLPR
jgi:signal transduction histidine kinase